MGNNMPIEEAASDAIGRDAKERLEHNPNSSYAAEFTSKRVLEAATAMPSPIDMLLKAQRRFIKSQTTYIHERSQDHMLGAQEQYINDLTSFLESMGIF
ncbi:MAG TPA: hypothetical protein VGI71_23990 [Scandinavium sp.]|jgi:hypothetical protein